MSTKALDRLARLDNEIATLQDRLNAKLDARRVLLEQMIEEGENQREVAASLLSISQAANFVSTGRILSDEQVRAIRKAHKDGESQCSLARRYGLAQPSIHKIVHRRSYQDVA